MVSANRQWRKAIAGILSTFTFVVITGGLVSCGGEGGEQENETQEQINQPEDEENEDSEENNEGNNREDND